ncbi:Fe-S oxidoreductase [Thermanaerovibrio velox DSM 12556]|uniref:Fe-S oxidoreductase n=2 Tax=Thermanaerovibrio TaxID=81461 RepID=H0URR8_9BACT|nr:Fe-S oxidoreductase [Thermanaerovibrio velox DSM 12556]
MGKKDSKKSASRSGDSGSCWGSWSSFREAEVWTQELPKGGAPRWALLYPGEYGIGSASLGFHHVYRRLRRMGVGVERFFIGPGPVYRSVDSDVHLRNFPIVTATISYENEVLSFTRWLEEGAIPPLRADRRDPFLPIVGAGGALTYINPFALYQICDFIVLGDAEVSLQQVVNVLRESHSKDDALKELASLPYVLVPSLLDLHRPQGVGKISELSQEDSISSWVTKKSLFESSLLLELQRGCRRACRFCTLTYCFSPMRRLPLHDAKFLIDHIKSKVPFERVGLITPEAGDYPEIRPLIETILALGKGISFASLRLDSMDSFMIKALKYSGGKSITLAPEAGTFRLRSLCGKIFTDDMIMEKAAMAASSGISKVKLYFMIGLPGETDDDLSGIGELCGSIISKTGLSVVASVNAFVPKPLTPWWEADFLDKKEYDRRVALIKKTSIAFCGRRKLELRFNGYREAAIENRLAWSLPEGPLITQEDLDASVGKKKQVLRMLAEIGIASPV